MSVYTSLTPIIIETLLERYHVGKLLDYRGINNGIENSNYYLLTTRGEWVLTIIEKLNISEMNKIIRLMHHLQEHQIPSQIPCRDKQGRWLQIFNEKPILLHKFLRGEPLLDTNTDFCLQIGSLLGQIHKCSPDTPFLAIDSYNLKWCQSKAAGIISRLSAPDKKLLTNELFYQENVKSSDMLPTGIIHTDLFIDNVLFHSGRISAIIDLYSAASGEFIYDLAVTINAWCANRYGEINPTKKAALINGYHQQRPLTLTERELLHSRQRFAALRYWLSRLIEHFHPRTGELREQRSPNEYRDILTSLSVSSTLTASSCHHG